MRQSDRYKLAKGKSKALAESVCCILESLQMVFFPCFQSIFFVQYFKTKSNCDEVVYVLHRPVYNSAFAHAV